MMRQYADLHVHMSKLDFRQGDMTLNVVEGMGNTRAALQSLTYRSVLYNLWLLYWKQHYKRMELSVFGMIHHEDLYRDIPFETQAQALLDMGCDGVKLMFDPHSRKVYGYGLNDPRMDKMFTLLEEQNIPVLIHVNDPEHMWVKRIPTEEEIKRDWCYFFDGYLSKQEIYDETFAMLDKHPKLRVTFAHFFFQSAFMDEAKRIMETYPNVNFDLTPGQGMFKSFSEDIDAWQAYFEKYSERIFYGTDTNNTKDFNAEIHLLVRQALTYPKTAEFKIPCYGGFDIKGLDLSERALNNIFSDNYDRWVGKPKAVNMALWQQAAARVLADISCLETDEMQTAADFLRQLMERM